MALNPFQFELEASLISYEENNNDSLLNGEILLPTDSDLDLNQFYNSSESMSASQSSIGSSHQTPIPMFPMPPISFSSPLLIPSPMEVSIESAVEIKNGKEEKEQKEQQEQVNQRDPLKIEVRQEDLSDSEVPEEAHTYPERTFLDATSVKKINKELMNQTFQKEELIFTSLIKFTEGKEDVALAKLVGKNIWIRKLIFRAGRDNPNPPPTICPAVFKAFSETSIAYNLSTFIALWGVDYKPQDLTPFLKKLCTNLNLSELRIKVNQQCIGMLATHIGNMRLRQLELCMIEEPTNKKNIKRGLENQPRLFSDLMKAIESHPTLLELTLNNSVVTDDDMTSLSNMLQVNRTLTKLKLYNNELSPNHYEDIFNGIAHNGELIGKGLRELEIINNPFGKRYANAQEAGKIMEAPPLSIGGESTFKVLLSSHKSLQSIRILNVAFQESIPFNAVFFGLEQNKTLTKLDFSYLSYHSRDERYPHNYPYTTLPGFSFKHRLKILKMRQAINYKYSARFMEEWVSRNHTLRVLNLSNCALSSESIALLAVTLSDPKCQIASLNLSNIEFFPKDFLALQAHHYLITQNIRNLFQALHSNTALTKLNLFNTSTTSEGIEAIQDFFNKNPKHNLRALKLTLGIRNFYFSESDPMGKKLRTQYQNLLNTFEQDKKLLEISITSSWNKRIGHDLLRLVSSNKLIQKMDLRDVHTNTAILKQINDCLADNTLNPDRAIAFLMGFHHRLGNHSRLLHYHKVGIGNGKNILYLSLDLIKLIMKFAGVKVIPKLKLLPNPTIPPLPFMPVQATLPNLVLSNPASMSLEDQTPTVIFSIPNKKANRSSQTQSSQSNSPSNTRIPSGGMGLSGTWGRATKVRKTSIPPEELRQNGSSTQNYDESLESNHNSNQNSQSALLQPEPPQPSPHTLNTSSNGNGNKKRKRY